MYRRLFVAGSDGSLIGEEAGDGVVVFNTDFFGNLKLSGREPMLGRKRSIDNG